MYHPSYRDCLTFVFETAETVLHLLGAGVVGCGSVHSRHNMESLYNPPDTMPLSEFFESIAAMTNNETAWRSFYRSILSTTAASSVGLLKKIRDADIDTALNVNKLSIGYKYALKEYLVPHGRKPFVFNGESSASVTEGKTYSKKFESQLGRHRWVVSWAQLRLRFRRTCSTSSGRSRKVFTNIPSPFTGVDDQPLS